ncbi:uncharacterized protein LOC131522468 [Onychostoma macrolepis]|uniref:uncharacterized protein LOC131522468 n=1 Tax=Onychostoma macrolepis TaxID=369639 RepID=UPI00272A67AA|nr:uncharacterized protein LOC131522468 [Onychostoma macrolepis]
MDIVTIMEEEFPKLQPLQGRWMFYKATGGSGQRRMTLISMDTEGYSGRQIRSVSNSGKNVLFLVPLQEEMDTQPLPYNSAEFAKMPKVPCVTCNTTMPLQMLALHAEECKLNSNENIDLVIVEDTDLEDQVTNTDAGARDVSEDSLAVCPICQKELPLSVLPYHGSLCAERSFSTRGFEDDMEQPGPSSGAHSSRISGPATEEWKTVENPQEAVQLFFEHLREGGKRQPTLFLSLDSRDTDEERDRSLISFYKQQREKNQWAAPFNCHIQGDAAIGIGVTRHILSTTIAKLKHGFKLNYGNAAETTLFEGEIDHLCLLMIGHSLINQGPALSGLSLAIVHSLTGGTKDTATTNLCLEDCPDIEQRETIRLLLKDEWTEDETSQVSNLCLDFYFAVPNKRSNKMLLFQQLLTHAVLGRAGAQLKQLKKGLKDTGVWPLISCRPDVLPLLFPRESEVEITPEMILQAIQWPQTQHTEDSEDSDADDIQPEKLNLVTGLLRTFVEHASPSNLRKLLKFWVGWEVVPRTLKLEVVQSSGPNQLPKAYTCQERIRLPDHYTSLSALTADMMVCLQSVESGFGLV